MKYFLFFFLLPLVVMFSCRPKVDVPRERGYFRTDFPAKQYRTFDSVFYPYTFDYPEYAVITRDSDATEYKNEPYWMNIEFPDQNAIIYITYKNFTNAQTLDALIEESYRLSYAHDKKADYITDTTNIVSAHGLTGRIYKVGGNAASAYQFFATDEKRNFLRGALYFNTSPNIDSIRPAIDFLKKDMDKLIETLQFK